MKAINVTNVMSDIPIYRPLIGMDKEEIISISRKIGAFETSVLPFEDCCTIFVAKHPVTKPDLSIIEKSERKLEEKIDEMVRTALETIEVIEVN